MASVKSTKYKENISKISNYIVDICKVVIIVFVINAFGISLCEIHGDSMEPTLHNGEFIVIEKVTKNYNYGDIVITDASNTLKESLIKRVIGLPGDIIDIDEKGVIYVNGKEIQEQMENATVGDIEYPHTVQENQLFLMGDNRNKSTDSRFKIVGNIDTDNIIGKVWFNIN